jgi:alpha-tubulin suppressor-like RCC1 family protein
MRIIQFLTRKKLARQAFVFPSSISAGLTSVFLDQNSYAWAWGSVAPTIGDNTSVAKSSPVSVAGGNQWRTISVGGTTVSSVHVLALDSNSYAWAWGTNIFGSLGNNTTNPQSSPVSVVGGRQFTKIFAGVSISVALDSNSYAWAWGDNSVGALGINTIANASSPVSVVGGKQWRTISVGKGNGTSSTGLGHVVGLDANSYAWAWGYNADGELGNNTVANASSPTSVVGGRQWTAISAGGLITVALDSNSYAWAWGTGTAGQLGDGTLTSKSSPVSVRGGQQWSAINAGVGAGAAISIAALDQNSYAWAWGSNTNGQLGNNTVTNASSPTSVVGGRQFSSVSMNGGAMLLLNAQGLYAAGVGTSLGQITNVNNASSPISVLIGKSSYPTNPFGK